jgi:Calcineurin-like phosphoesterase
MRPSVLIAFLATAVAAQAQMPPAVQLPNGAPRLKAHPAKTKFSFVVAGDNRPAKPTDPLTQPYLDIVQRVAKQRPAFVVWDGDTVFGKKAVGTAAQYKQFLHALRKLPVPVFNAPGNHELVVQSNIPCNGGSWSAELPDWSGAMLAEYNKAMGPAYGMFRYGNAAFLLVNTDDVPDVAIPTACDYNGIVSQAQLTALQTSLDQLGADDSVAHIFVFMHRPIIDDNYSQLSGPAGTPYGARIEQFRSLLNGTAHPKVTFVFASHDHRFYVSPASSSPTGPFTSSGPTTSNPIFIVTGGAGAPLTGCKNGSGPAGSYFHYVTVDVDGANVTVNVNPLYGTTPCATKSTVTAPAG